ncbi:hypothetical protein HDU76_003924 [Blyttiomyces sp. JEL0837]|nr:hypothetical protein HDU76_003924 [Blyttiomyces sp. JEL0837]
MNSENELVSVTTHPRTHAIVLPPLDPQTLKKVTPLPQIVTYDEPTKVELTTNEAEISTTSNAANLSQQNITTTLSPTASQSILPTSHALGPLNAATSSTSIITISTNKLAEIKKQSVNVLQSINQLSESRNMGSSTPNEATLKLLDVKMNWFFLSFKDMELEREFQENANIRYRQANERDFLMGAFMLLLYTLLITLVPGTRNAAFKQDIANSIALIVIICCAFVGKIFGEEHIRKYYHIWVASTVFLGGFTVFVMGSYFTALEWRLLPNFTVNLSGMMIAGLYVSFAVPISKLFVSYAWYDDPFNYFTIWTTYGFAIISALKAVHEQEKSRRKVFLMERHLAKTILFSGQNIWKIPDSAIVGAVLERSPTTVLSSVIETSLKNEREFATQTLNKNQYQNTLYVDNIRPSQARRASKVSELIKNRLRPADQYRQIYANEFCRLDEQFEKWDRGAFLKEVRVMLVATLLADFALTFIDESA